MLRGKFKEKTEIELNRGLGKEEAQYQQDRAGNGILKSHSRVPHTTNHRTTDY